MDVSRNIKAIRSEKGITQAEIAKLIGVERTNYHRLENRGAKLTVEQLQQIAKALGVTLIDLLTWGEEKLDSQDVGDTEESRSSSAKLKELERNSDFIQDYIESLKHKIQMVDHEFLRIIQYTGEEAKLGTVHVHEETEEYGLYYTTFTNKELYEIFDRLYVSNNKLYSLFRHFIQSDIIAASRREAKLFMKHSEQKMKELIERHGGLFE